MSERIREDAAKIAELQQAVADMRAEITKAERKCRAKIDAIKDFGPDIFTVHYVDGYHKGISHMVAALTDKGGTDEQHTDS